MKKYVDTIRSAKLLGSLRSCQTTGDLDYNGTALEVETSNGEELFHVVVDEQGVQQVLFWEHDAPYRIDLGELEAHLAKAKEVVRHIALE